MGGRWSRCRRRHTISMIHETRCFIAAFPLTQPRLYGNLLIGQYRRKGDIPLHYNFDDQLAKGQYGEEHLDKYFASRGNIIVRATTEQERNGIDRAFTTSTGETITVEYKTDSKTFHTGNAFIETISVDRPPERIALGWAVKSQADFLYYYVPERSEVCIVRMGRIRALLPQWITQFPLRGVYNPTWMTWGLLVPYARLVEIGRTIPIGPIGPPPPPPA